MTTRRSWDGKRQQRIGRFLLFLILATGCAGPKRLPPVDYSAGSGGSGFPSVPNLLGIGLLEGESRLALGTTGAALVLGEGSSDVLARLEGEGAELVCRPEGEGELVAWQVGQHRGTAASVRLQPVDPGHRVRQGEAEYRGEFLVIPTPGGPGLTLVNSLDVESYLQGVVPWEIGRHGPEKLAALQAQAVAARTYTASHLGARRSRGFDLFASVMDQVYKGSRGEDPLCNQAIDMTRGLILTFDGEPIDAYYSACCGGVSSLIEEVWPYPPEPYLQSRPDVPENGGPPFCADYKYFNWRESWTAQQLETILQTTLPEYLDYMARGERPGWTGPVFSPRDGESDPGLPGALYDLEIIAYTTSGRVAQLAVTTRAGVYHVRGDRTRWVLKPAGGKPAILRSALFQVELTRRNGELTQVAVRGKGYGHGIGLCQVGALAMAARDYTFQEILAHYYPGAVLVHGKTDR